MAVKKIEQMLDEQGTLGNLPRWGKLRKGAPKPDDLKKGLKDLDYFRLTLEPPYAHLMAAFIAKYSDKPREFHNVYLVGDSADNAFQYWYEQRAHARIEKRCDGEEIVMSWSGSNSRYDHTHHDCTCDPNNPTCKLHGKMDIVLPEFCTEMGEWGKLTIETGSWYDIIALRKSMRLAAVFAANLPDVVFWSIPFRVGRAIRPVQVTINGQRSNKPMSLLYADPEKEFNRKVFSPILNAPTQMLLAGTNPATGEIPELVIEQFAAWDRDYVNEQTLHLFDNENHQYNAIEQIIADGNITDTMQDDEVIQTIGILRQQREVEKQQETKTKKPRKNAAKSNVEGSNSSAVDEPDVSQLEWVADTPTVNKFLTKALANLKLDHDQVMRGLQWAMGDYSITQVSQFVGTKEDAWASCVVVHCGYDPDQVAEYITDPANPVRIQAMALLARIADVPF